jgi:hypothetical protein
MGQRLLSCRVVLLVVVAVLVGSLSLSLVASPVGSRAVAEEPGTSVNSSLYNLTDYSLVQVNSGMGSGGCFKMSSWTSGRWTFWDQQELRAGESRQIAAAANGATLLQPVEQVTWWQIKDGQNRYCLQTDTVDAGPVGTGGASCHVTDLSGNALDASRTPFQCIAWAGSEWHGMLASFRFGMRTPTTHYVDNATQQARAGTLMSEYCDHQITWLECKYTVDNLATTFSVLKNVGRRVYNCSSAGGATVSYAVSWSDSVSESNNLGIAVSSKLEIPKTIKVTVTAAFSHTWTTGRTISHTDTITVSPGNWAQMAVAYEIDRVTGRFTYTVDDDTWVVTNANWTSPLAATETTGPETVLKTVGGSVARSDCA